VKANTTASRTQKDSWVIPVAVGVTVPTVGAACIVIIWLAIKQKHHLQHGLCDCSPGRRHWLHMLCLKPHRSLPNEADGVPVRARPTAPAFRVVGSAINELPAHELPRRMSQGRARYSSGLEETVGNGNMMTHGDLRMCGVSMRENSWTDR
jgi:hypothetical protein